MAPKRPWRSGLTLNSASPVLPSPTRPSYGPGPGPHPCAPPNLRGAGRSAAPRGGRRAMTLAPRIAAGRYGALPGRCREETGHDLFSKCILGDFDSPGRAGGSGELPTTGPAGDHWHDGVVAPSGGVGPSCRPIQPRPPPAPGQRGIRHRVLRSGRAARGVRASHE